jgi:MinD-like ATPase involved in chromosome partitioning or flagellar assembly
VHDGAEQTGDNSEPRPDLRTVTWSDDGYDAPTRMSSDWQSDVLREIGAAIAGLVVVSADGPPSTAAPFPQRPPEPLRPGEPDGVPTGHPLHGDPVLRRARRGILRAVGASAAREMSDWTDVVARLQQPVTTTRRIAVTSLRGGAGKTTIATLVASALAQHRNDRVLLVDADPGFGTMRLRLGIASAPPPQELSGRRFESFEDALPFLARTAAGLWILPGADPALELDAFKAISAALHRFFAIVVIDCGAGLDGVLQQDILANAHSHLHVSPSTTDGAVSAHRALEWLSSNGYRELVPYTVVAFAAHAPHSRANLAPTAEFLRSRGITVAHFAYDRHLASGGVLAPGMLAESTRFAAINIAAEALTKTRH